MDDRAIVSSGSGSPTAVDERILPGVDERRRLWRSDIGGTAAARGRTRRMATHETRSVSGGASYFLAGDRGRAARTYRAGDRPPAADEAPPRPRCKKPDARSRNCAHAARGTVRRVNSGCAASTAACTWASMLRPPPAAPPAAAHATGEHRGERRRAGALDDDTAPPREQRDGRSEFIFRDGHGLVHARSGNREVFAPIRRTARPSRASGRARSRSARRARTAARKLAACAGSTATTARVAAGFSPRSRHPRASRRPPTGTTSTSTSGTCSRISSAHRALAGDDVGIVEGMHERRAQCAGEFARVRLRGVEGFAVQHDLGAESAAARDLHLRGGFRHHDGHAHAQLRPVKRQPERVVARRGRDDPAGAGRRVEASNACRAPRSLNDPVRWRSSRFNQIAMLQSPRAPVR